MPRLADPLRSFLGAFVAIVVVAVLAAVAVIIAPWVQLAIAAYNAGPTTNSAIEVSQVALSSALLTITTLYLIATAIVAWASTWGARHAGISARAALGGLYMRCALNAQRPRALMSFLWALKGVQLTYPRAGNSR